LVAKTKYFGFGLKKQKDTRAAYTFLFETNAVGIVRNYFKTVAAAYVSIYASVSSFFVMCFFLIVAVFIISSLFPGNAKYALPTVLFSACLLIK